MAHRISLQEIHHAYGTAKVLDGIVPNPSVFQRA